MAKKSTKPCDCVKQLNQMLASRGIELETAFSMDFKAGKGTVEGPFMAVRWKDKPIRGKRLPTLVCNFCPVCGKKKAN